MRHATSSVRGNDISRAGIDFRVDDFLRDNRHFYADKAKRRKIVILRIHVVNRESQPVQLDLNAATSSVENAWNVRWLVARSTSEPNQTSSVL